MLTHFEQQNEIAAKFAEQINNNFHGMALEQYAVKRINSMMEDRFAASHTSYVKPEAQSIYVRANANKTTLSINSNIMIDYRIFLQNIQKTTSTPYECARLYSDMDNYDEFYGVIDGLFEKLVALLIDTIGETQNNLCSENGLFKYRCGKMIKPKIEIMEALVEKLFCIIDINAKCNDLCDRFNKSAGLMSVQGIVPIGFAPLKMMSTSFDSTITDEGKIKMNVKAMFADGIERSFSDMRSVAAILMQRTEESCIELMNKATEAVLTRAEDEFYTISRTYFTKDINTIPLITADTIDLITSGKLHVGHFWLKWSSACYNWDPLYTQPKTNTSFVFTTLDFANPRKSGFPLLPKNTLSDIKAFQFFPASIPELITFCDAFSALLIDKATEHGETPPTVSLKFNQYMNGWIEFKKYFVDLSTVKNLTGKKLQSRIEEIANDIVAEISSTATIAEAQIKALNSFPLVDRAILKFIYLQKCDGTWASEIYNCIGKVYSMKRTDVKSRLDSLCRRRILDIDGNYTPILSSEIKYNRRTGEPFVFYAPHADISKRALVVV